MIHVNFAEYCFPDVLFFCLYPVWSCFVTSLVALYCTGKVSSLQTNSSNMQQHLLKTWMSMSPMNPQKDPKGLLFKTGRRWSSFHESDYATQLSKGSTSLMELRWEQLIACQMSRRELLGINCEKEIGRHLFDGRMAYPWRIFLISIENAEWFWNLVSWLSLNECLPGNSDTEAILGSFE